MIGNLHKKKILGSNFGLPPKTENVLEGLIHDCKAGGGDSSHCGEYYRPLEKGKKGLDESRDELGEGHYQPSSRQSNESQHSCSRLGQIGTEGASVEPGGGGVPTSVTTPEEPYPILELDQLLTYLTATYMEGFVLT